MFNRFNLLFFFFLIFNCVSASSQTDLYSSTSFPRSIDLGKPVGSTKGSSTVLTGGSASYSIPIICAPGTNGVTPKLSINYISSNVNGELGQGWSIGGVSVITRRGTDLFHDGKSVPVTFSNYDNFILDGQRLEVKTGFRGGSGSTYRTEIESYDLITSEGSFGGGPAYFTVKDKNGTIREYGRSIDSRVMTDDGGSIMIWKLNRVIDISGNYIDYVYESVSREHRLMEVNYTGNDGAGLSPYNKIKFFYDPRNDKNTLYESGSSLAINNRLFKIEVYSEGVKYKSYQFEYGYRDGVSYLNNIQEFASDNSSLNDLRFFYGDMPSEEFSIIKTNLIAGAEGNDRFMGSDFNGDGFTDVLICSQNTPGMVDMKTYYSGTGTSTYTLGSSSATSAESYLAGTQNNFKANGCIPSDFNGDGRDDILAIAYHKSYFVEIWDQMGIYSPDYATGTVGSTSITVPSSDYTRVPDNKSKLYFVGDFDGDKRADYLQIAWDFISDDAVDRGDWTPKYGAFVTFPARGLYNIPICFPYSSLLDNNWIKKLVNDQISIIDFDGDGRSDILGVTNDLISSVYVLNLKETTTGGIYLN